MSTVSLLRQPQFRRIFLAQTVSTLGDNIAPIAVAFAVLATRESAVDLGLVLAARMLPLALFSFASFATYEEYRKWVFTDPDCLAASKFAADTQCIRRWERRFLSPVFA